MTVPEQKDFNLGSLMAAPSLRSDLWLELLAQARSLAHREPGQALDTDKFSELLAKITQTEKYFAYPGSGVLDTLAHLLAEQDIKGLLKLTQSTATSIIAQKYAQDPDLVEHGESDSSSPADRLPPSLSSNSHRPYFEVLSVVPHAPSRWPHIVQESRAVRRPEDEFIYDVVVTGNAEDALTAVILNHHINAVVLYEGFGAKGAAENPIVAAIQASVSMDLGNDEEEYAQRLATLIHRIRPELDIYLLSDRSVEKLAADASNLTFRRIFYQVEEALELHLSILEGIRDRFSTPFFDNLKRYAQRPISTFHALPIARGKSIFKSNWIRDMAEFYGTNLFLAESSATTGGLDSLLEPTGNIKVAQEKAARAFGAQEAYFVTNGTSTSNKIVLQALLAPGDIVIIDRNCHKSHHYGCVLSGAQPYYVEAYPLTEYSMYGAVPLATIKRALLTLKAEGQLDKVKMVDLTNCTFDGHVYNVRRVMEECLAIKPDLIFLWDEAWFGFAHWSPLLRQRTAMGAAAALTEHLQSDAARTAYARQRDELGDNPDDARLLATRLVPDPDKVLLRVYQTNSVHKSMSALRQGSIVLAHDVLHEKVKGRFREAIFTHSTTSPNQQIIATLDLARRQMELEGYGLVTNAIQIALSIRRAVNHHPLISKYFRILTNENLVPAEYRDTGINEYTAHDLSWADAAQAIRQDEFLLDPTRLTLLCGTAGFDGTSFKKLLADKYSIQVNKTSRNSILLQSNINNTRSDIAMLLRVLIEISIELEKHLADPAERARFEQRVQSLIEDVPHLPNFSAFDSRYRDQADSTTLHGDIRTAFFDAYDDEQCAYLALNGPEIDQLLASGANVVSANFVIPYPPGFPILVPGQLITSDVIEFMRKLDVKEIHGYDASLGLKVIQRGQG